MVPSLGAALKGDVDGAIGDDQPPQITARLPQAPNDCKLPLVSVHVDPKLRIS